MKAEEIFKQARALLEGRQEDGTPITQDWAQSEYLLNELLNNCGENPKVLYVLGTLYLHQRKFGLAAFLLKHVVNQAPDFGEAWNNLGLTYKELKAWDAAVECISRGASILGHADMWSNLAGCYINRGMPSKALLAASKALAKDPSHIKARWHKALAHLEAGEFEKAWELHETRLIGGANENIAERNYHGPDGMTPFWDGKSKGTVVVHGEQGMGDEIMFLTCLRDAISTGADIILEPSPRLQGLLKRSFPEILVHGTDRTDGKGWIEDRGKPDFKCPLGTLPKFWRNRKDSFPSGAYLKPHEEYRAAYRKRLDALGKGLKIGVAWQGGVPATRVETRSIHPANFKPIYEAAKGAIFVSLQYDPTARMNVDEVKEKTGVTIHHWPEAVEARDPQTGKPSDLDHLAALISCLDLVITIPQTCYHIAGALGVPTWVMTPSEPDWRLGVKGEDNPWYGSVKLYRQKKADHGWTEVINAISEDLKDYGKPV